MLTKIASTSWSKSFSLILNLPGRFKIAKKINLFHFLRNKNANIMHTIQVFLMYDIGCFSSVQRNHDNMTKTEVPLLPLLACVAFASSSSVNGLHCLTDCCGFGEQRVK